MTLIVAMKADQAIILAGDSRGTIGDPRGLTAINDNQVKIFAFGRCGLGIAGASEMGSALLDEFRKAGIDKLIDKVSGKGKDSKPYDADFIMKRTFEEASNAFSKWFKDIPPDKRPGVLLTLAGYRYSLNVNPEPMIYLLNSQANFAPQLMSNIVPCMSGVPQYAVYLTNRYYSSKMPIERAKALAEYLISETASQDPKVGGPIRIAEITPDKGYRELDENEVKQINQSNAALNQRLRQFFLAGDTP